MLENFKNLFLRNWFKGFDLRRLLSPSKLSILFKRLIISFFDYQMFQIVKKPILNIKVAKYKISNADNWGVKFLPFQRRQLASFCLSWGWGLRGGEWGQKIHTASRKQPTSSRKVCRFPRSFSQPAEVGWSLPRISLTHSLWLIVNYQFGAVIVSTRC